jgi:hypothetical protein
MTSLASAYLDRQDVKIQGAESAVSKYMKISRIQAEETDSIILGSELIFFTFS